MPKNKKSSNALAAEIAQLKARLAEAEETLNAIRTGSVDAWAVGGQVFSIKGAGQNYRALVEAMNEGAVTVSGNGTILYCNERFAEIVQTPLERVIGKSFQDFVRVGWREKFYHFLHASCRSRSVEEVLLTTSTHREVFVHLSGNPFLFDGQEGISVVVTDITKRKEMEEHLRKSEERFQTVAVNVSDAIWDWDVTEKVVWRSPGFNSIFRYPVEKVDTTFEWWVQNLHPEDRKAVVTNLEAVLRAKPTTYRHYYRFRRGDGIYVDVEDRASAIYNEKGILRRVIGTVSDITERKKTEAAKLELSKNILNAQEQERQRVARELHDGVNQLLSSGKYRLHSIKEHLARNDKALGKKVEEAQTIIEKAIAEIRLISRNLRPSELDDLGLAAAVRSLCEEFRERTGIMIETKIALGTLSLPKTVELTIYRIIQEALNNVEKHSGASEVSISLAPLPDGIALTICDNGRGFDIANVRKTEKSGWGLDNMRERASYLGGRMAVKSVPQKGTEITLQIPL